MVITVGGELGGVVDATALSFFTLLENEVECDWASEPDRRGDWGVPVVGVAGDPDVSQTSSVPLPLVIAAPTELRRELGESISLSRSDSPSLSAGLPGKNRSSSIISKAAPGFITREISSKRASHLSSGTPRAILLICTKSNSPSGKGSPARRFPCTHVILFSKSGG